VTRLANVWHLAETPSGPYAHQLDPDELDAYVAQEMADDPALPRGVAEAEAVGAACERIRRELGFPKNGRWVDREGWQSALSYGEPHPKFLEKATVVRQGVDP
jgi:hypothetical protein